MSIGPARHRTEVAQTVCANINTVSLMDERLRNVLATEFAAAEISGSQTRAVNSRDNFTSNLTQDQILIEISFWYPKVPEAIHLISPCGRYKTSGAHATLRSRLLANLTLS